MKGLETKVEEFRKKQERINNIKKQLIDAEISWLVVRQELKLSQYEYIKLKNGDLEAREKEMLKMIKRTPIHILNRNKETKEFKKMLIDRGIGIKQFCEENKINHDKLYRILRGTNVNRDHKTEKQIERALGAKVF